MNTPNRIGEAIDRGRAGGARRLLVELDQSTADLRPEAEGLMRAVECLENPGAGARHNARAFLAGHRGVLGRKRIARLCFNNE